MDDAREPSGMPSSEPPPTTAGFNSYIPSSSMVMTGLTGILPNNLHLSYSPILPSVSKPVGTSGSFHHADSPHAMRPCSNVLSTGEPPVKKKRGRPRKYRPDGSSMALALAPLSSASPYSNSSVSEPSAKRRGRPPGSGRKQQLDALGSAGIAFTPHVITVKAGEDVASKIIAFSQQGPRTVCILSANGAICKATLRQPATYGGTSLEKCHIFTTRTYEGRFEILSLSGSFFLTENGGTCSRTGGLSVSLAGSDGHVLGGEVAGMLTAASPVQMVVGSFIAEGKKLKLESIKHEPSSTPPQVPGLPINREPLSSPPQIPGFGAASASSPPSQGTSSESSDDSGSPNEQSGETCNDSQHVQNVPQCTSVSWSHSMLHRHDPEVKMRN